MAATAEPCRNASAGSIGAALQPGADQVAQLIDTHVAASTITFDPKYPARILTMPVGALSRVESHRRPLGSVTASDEDMHWLDPVAM